MATALSPTAIQAQVFDPGPSDPALFDIVFSLPPDPNIGNGEALGGVTGQTIQLNISEGGEIGSSFDALLSIEVNISGGNIGSFFDAQSGSEVNISGGNIGNSFDAFSGSEVSISGGNIGNSFDAFSGSEVKITGGRFGIDFDARSGSNVELVGGEFSLNGATFTEPSITLNGEDVFAGTLADGSTFIFSTLDSDDLNTVTLTAASTPLPPIDTSPVVLTSQNTALSSLRSGQTLTVSEGGELGDSLTAISAILNIEQGIVGDRLAIYDSIANISSGSLGDNFSAFSGSVVNITGGTVGSFASASTGSVVNISSGDVGSQFRAFTGSEVNISGGDIGSSFTALSESEVNISGGDIGSNFRALTGCEVNITGGNIGSSFDAQSGSIVNISGGDIGLGFDALSGSEVNINSGSIGGFFDAFSGSNVTLAGGHFDSRFRVATGSNVELIGGEFLLNGNVFGDSSITLNEGDVFTGTLADGSAFLFSPILLDEIANVTLTAPSTPLPPIDTTPIVLTAQNTSLLSLRSGQTLTVSEGGKIGESFTSVGATLNVSQGTVGDHLETYDSITNISIGSVGSNFSAFFGSVVNITGGTVGFSFSAYSGSEVNMSGGNIASSFNAKPGSIVNISAGSIGSGFDAESGSIVNMSAGNIGSGFDAESGSVLNMSGGNLGSNFDAESGSIINISGGTIGSVFNARSGSAVEISGGAIGTSFKASLGSSVELIGGEFVLNGSTFTGSSISLNSNDLFTGTLADGSPFIFDPLTGDELNSVTLTPSPTPLPPIDATPLFLATSDLDRPGLRVGQTLTLQDGGEVGDSFAVVDATLNIEQGGRAGSNLRSSNAEVNLLGGHIESFRTSHSIFNMDSGTVSRFLGAASGSVVSISGGLLGSLTASSGSELRISGGVIGATFRALAGSEVELIGGEFQLNGIEFTDSNITLTENDVFTGVLSDGSPFIFSPLAGDILTNVTLTPSPTPIPASDIIPMVLTSTGTRPSGLRPNQVLTLPEGDSLITSFAVIGANLNIEGGSADEGLEVVAGEININGGSFESIGAFAESVVNINGGNFESIGAFTGSVVSINGGKVDIRDNNSATGFASYPDSRVNFNGGEIRVESFSFQATGFTAFPNSVVNLNGANVSFVGETPFLASSGSVVNIRSGLLFARSLTNTSPFVFDYKFNSGSTLNMSGGTLGGNIEASSGSEINLFGTEFFLNGIELDSLVLDEAFTLPDRNVTLTGKFADGRGFRFDLDDTISNLSRVVDFFASDSLLTLTRVSPVSDFDIWATIFGVTGGPTDDGDEDGVSNFEEYAFGLDPNSGGSTTPYLTTPSPTSGSFSYTRRNPDLTELSFSYSYSTTLEPDSFIPFTAVETSDENSPTETITATVPPALLENGQLFVRITAGP